MISQTADYALRAVVHLAGMGGGPAVAEEIAEATRVPKGYLARILRRLARSRILTAQRGIGGGFALAKPAGKLSVWDIIQAADGGFERIETCPLGISEHGVSLCALHKLLDDAIAEVQSVFKKTTIQDILQSSRKSKPLCAGPSPIEPEA